jgi:dihydroorotate dehydrogenase
LIAGTTKKERNAMSKLAALTLAALLSSAITPQAWAQAANPEPGFCAQFYPNEDCNGIGPATPGSRTPENAAESEPSEAAPAIPPARTPVAKKKKHQSSAAVAPAK